MTEENKNTLITRPSYVTVQGQEDREFLQEAQKYMQPPRLKIIQKTSGEEFTEHGKEGDIILVPHMLPIGGLETPFTFVPLAFFPTFICINPYKMKGTLPFIRHMEFDENSEVAKKARALVQEPCPENQNEKIKYGVALNYLIMIEDMELPTSLPIAMFFRSGDFKTGQILLSMIQERNSKSYLCRFTGHSQKNVSQGNPWYGYTFMNAPDPWIPESKVEFYSKLAIEVRELVKLRKIQIDMEDSDVQQEDAANETKF